MFYSIVYSFKIKPWLDFEASKQTAAFLLTTAAFYQRLLGYLQKEHMYANIIEVLHNCAAEV
jgi:hypothetical protein